MISNQGDVDNRVKVLFDALRIPENPGEIPRDAIPGDDESPLFCLLQDDRLITEVKITTDRLLVPVNRLADVHLVISVKIRDTGLDGMVGWGVVPD